MSYDDETNVHAYFADMPKLQHDNLGYTEYLHAVYDLSSFMDENEEKCLDTIINLSDFVPEPKSFNQVIRLSGIIKEKWWDVVRKEINGLFDNGTFLTSEMILPTDDVIPVKVALKAKMNAHGGLDKLKVRIYLRGDMQLMDDSNPWSPTTSSRLLRCFIADAISHKAIIYQLDSIQAFIQSEMKKRMFVILNNEYEQFCPNQKVIL